MDTAASSQKMFNSSPVPEPNEPLPLREEEWNTSDSNDLRINMGSASSSQSKFNSSAATVGRLQVTRKGHGNESLSFEADDLFGFEDVSLKPVNCRDIGLLSTYNDISLLNNTSNTNDRMAIKETTEKTEQSEDSTSDNTDEEEETGPLYKANDFQINMGSASSSQRKFNSSTTTVGRLQVTRKRHGNESLSFEADDLSGFEDVSLKPVNCKDIGLLSTYTDISLLNNTSNKNDRMAIKETTEEQTEQSEDSTSDNTNEEEEAGPLYKANEFHEYREQTFDRLRKKSVKVLQLDKNVFTSNREKTVEILAELMFIDVLFISCENKGQSREDYESYKKELCEIMLELKLLETFVQILNEVPREKDFIKTSLEQKQTIAILMRLLHNCTDISDAFAIAVARTKVMELAKEILDVNFTEYITGTTERITSMVIGSCHGIAHNTSMREVNVDRLRDLDFISTLEPYLRSPKAIVRISVLATLANIVTEKECEIISNHVLVVGQLLTLLNNAMASDTRRCEGWSCKECVFVIRQLARNDTIKKLLFDLEAIQSLVKLAISGDKEEQLESILGILALSFEDKIRTQITTNQNLGVVDLLMSLKATSKNNDIKSTCKMTLWNIKDDLLVSTIDSYKKSGEQMQQKNENETTEAGHVMISYQRNDRELLLIIKDKLKRNGFKVWMDVDEMGGCVYETMAKAVENAKVILMCYSKKYKESENCKYEAKYAHKLKKVVIPLKMERDYEPDGWLGLLLKSDYFIEFSGKYDNQKKFNELVALIKKFWPS